MHVTRVIASLPLLLPVLAGCEKKSTSDDAPPPSPIRQVAAAPAAPTPEFAPPGVFYLIKPARIETSDGIVGLPPGTSLKLVRPGVYLSPSGEVQLGDDQVTNNVTFARQVISADQKTQAVLRNSLATAAHQAEVQRRAAGQQAAANTQSMNDQARRTRIAVLTAQRDSLQQQLNSLEVQRNGEDFRHTYQRRIIGSTTREQIASVQQQLMDVQTELAALNAAAQ